MTKSVVISAIAAAVVVALVWSVVRDRRSEPYAIDRAWLTGWEIVAGEADDPWVVAAQPPAPMIKSLYQEVSEKAGQPLVAPPHTALPLVLRPEYEDALQGVNGIDSILRLARESLRDTVFEPVCIGHRAGSGDAPGEMFFVAFRSAEFSQLRADLLPDHPEHAGIGIYDPGALSPVLPVAATDANFTRWWPINVEELPDCQAQLLVR